MSVNRAGFLCASNHTATHWNAKKAHVGIRQRHSPLSRRLEAKPSLCRFFWTSVLRARSHEGCVLSVLRHPVPIAERPIRAACVHVLQGAPMFGDRQKASRQTGSRQFHLFVGVGMRPKSLFWQLADRIRYLAKAAIPRIANFLSCRFASGFLFHMMPCQVCIISKLCRLPLLDGRLGCPLQEDLHIPLRSSPKGPIGGVRWTRRKRRPGDTAARVADSQVGINLTLGFMNHVKASVSPTLRLLRVQRKQSYCG